MRSYAHRRQDATILKALRISDGLQSSRHVCHLALEISPDSCVLPFSAHQGTFATTEGDTPPRLQQAIRSRGGEGGLLQPSRAVRRADIEESGRRLPMRVTVRPRGWDVTGGRGRNP